MGCIFGVGCGCGRMGGANIGGIAVFASTFRI